MKLRTTIPNLLLMVSALSACSAETPPNAQTPQALAAAMQGAFETAPGDPDNNFIDQRQTLDLGGESAWVYMQINSGPERKVYRQRVLELIAREDGVRQRAWTLSDPASVLSEDGWPLEASALLTKDNITPGFGDEGCEQVWQLSQNDDDWMWTGTVNPETCIIQSKRRGKEIRIGSDSQLTAQGLKQAERGFDLDGTQLWGTAPGDYAVLYRK